MKTRTYLLFAGGATLVWVLALLLIPSFAQSIEQLMLTFLATNAR
jgi:hypothetical protein